MQTRTSFSIFLLILPIGALLVVVRGFTVTPPKVQQQSQKPCRVHFPHCRPPKQAAASHQGMMLHSSSRRSTSSSSGSGSISTLEVKKKISYLQPPPYLADLDVGASIDIDEENGGRKITKLANDPPLFWVQNFLSREDCETLMEAAHLVLQDAETKQGIVEHRVGSKVAWMGEDDDDDDMYYGDNDEEYNLPDHVIIAGYTQQLSVNLFLPHAPQVEAERLQVVQYDQNGKYDIHHDGFNRTVTVLTYLNGVAGTWFPYAGAATSDADIPLQRQLNSQVDLLSHKKPGRDGLCMVSSSCSSSSNDDEENNHVVQVRPGDAIVFYNYQDHPDHGGIMSWKSLHCGLPATREKWIATNWLRANDGDENQT